jgi:hypothetical protein
MASRIPALPRDSHVQSHAAVHENKLCDSHAALVARAIAGGWTRPTAASRLRQLPGTGNSQSRRNQGTASNTAKAISTHIGHAMITGPCQKPQPGISPVTSRIPPTAYNIGMLSRIDPIIWTATFIASFNPFWLLPTLVPATGTVLPFSALLPTYTNVPPKGLLIPQFGAKKCASRGYGVPSSWPSVPPSSRK